MDNAPEVFQKNMPLAQPLQNKMKKEKMLFDGKGALGFRRRIFGLSGGVSGIAKNPAQPESCGQRWWYRVCQNRTRNATFPLTGEKLFQDMVGKCQELAKIQRKRQAMTASGERKYVPLVKQLGKHISALQELILFGWSDEMRDGMSAMVAATSATAIASRFQVTKPAGMGVMATKSPSALSIVGGMGSKSTGPSAEDDGKPTGNGCQLHSPRDGKFHNKNLSYFPT